MSSQAATLKRGAILASIVVSSYAVFGHDAWAPEPAQLTAALGGASPSAAAYYVNTGEPTTVLKWPSTWTAGSHLSGTPCSSTALAEGMIADHLISRIGNYEKCTMWINPGARLTAGLSGIRSTASATILSGEHMGETTTVVQFPPTWTYDTTLATETYCATWQALADEAVGSIIVRSGDYAKCSY